MDFDRISNKSVSADGSLALLTRFDAGEGPGDFPGFTGVETLRQPFLSHSIFCWTEANMALQAC